MVSMMATNGQDHDRIQIPNDGAPPPASKPDSTLGDKMLSAITGSLLTSLLVTPLDVVRVRLQSQQQQPRGQTTDFSHASAPAARSFTNMPPNLGVTACCREVFWVNNNAPFCVMGSGGVAQTEGIAEDCAVEEVQRKRFTSTFDGLRKIARNEGFTTLWRGLSPTLVMAVPGNVIYFAGYDWLKGSPVSPFHGRLTEQTAPLVAGSTARVLAAIVVSPIELFRTRMQATQSKNASENFASTVAGVRDMVNTQGYFTLWRGLSMTLWRDVPFSAFYWWGYEKGRKMLLDLRAVGDTSKKPVTGPRTDELRRQQNMSEVFADSFVAGLLSGGISAVITTPFDVGKTRQQVYQYAEDASKSHRNGGTLRADDRSMPKLLWHIMKEEGTAGLFRGWAPRVLKVAPACAIMVSSYEIGKRTAQKAREKGE